MDHLSPTPNRFEASPAARVSAPLQRDYTKCQTPQWVTDMNNKINATMARIPQMDTFTDKGEVRAVSWKEHLDSPEEQAFQHWEAKHPAPVPTTTRLKKAGSWLYRAAALVGRILFPFG